jgi:hypothetical protein
MTTTLSTHATRSDRTTTSWGRWCAVSGVVMVLLTPVMGIRLGDPVPGSWAEPHGPRIFLVESVALAVLHVLSALGFLGAWRQTGRRALLVAAGGLGLLSAAELASGAIGSSDVDSGAAAAVGTVFGVATLVFTAGCLVAWRTHWSVWALGLVILLLVTPANVSGEMVLRQLALAVWSALFVPLGLAVTRGRLPQPSDRH